MTPNQVTAPADLLGRILDPSPPPFALLHRPETVGRHVVEVLVGDVSMPETVADIPLPARFEHSGDPRHEVLAIIPYRRIVERGFAGRDDGSPLIAMTVTGAVALAMSDVLARIPDRGIHMPAGSFDVDDDAYADIVRQVVAREIGAGAGSNFVIKRTYVADITEYTLESALILFRRLLMRESGAYWTFLVHTGTRTFVGATPERHLSLRDGVAVMNPISGTYRYPEAGPTLQGILSFLADRKETDELFMVVDEELKMMARICDTGGRVSGPYLKEMAQLAHTEYLIDGHTTHDPRYILRETMFAPTVTGSPVENACRVINRYEPQGRGYYSGTIALIGHDSSGGHTLDSAILIRTADIESTGRLRIGVGSTLVRHSDPAAEAAETRAKAAGLLTALAEDGTGRLRQHPSVRAALESRNVAIADFWLTDEADRVGPDPVLAGRRALVVDAEDTFTSMLDHQLRALGLSVTVRRFDETYPIDGPDVVVMGPGPGDPHDLDDPRIAHLHSVIGRLLAERRPLLAVCLSHQVLCAQLGLGLRRRQVPNQGVQHVIDVFGRSERVGFYNTFAAHCDTDRLHRDDLGAIAVSRDCRTGEVHALRGPRFASIQFHAESVLTQNGPRIIADRLKEVMDP